ncbi:hypothetical protein M3Y99_00464800 [Aphelenchoides fujianensis]|nr:hypothetical protein M3Y99_00929300 [Aphelenchoides fujianensis]KAI6240331.1 hypothetical protein M3Y99_00464800 [Aphelenchoides fujianensis]
MKSSVLSVLLLVLLVPPSEAARGRRHRQRKHHGNAHNQQQVLRIPFVRQTAESPQVVEVLVGTPPQKLKLAVTYGVQDSDKVITLINGADQVYDCPAEKNLSRYNPQASKTFEELPKNEEYGAPDHREKFAFGADPTHVHSFEFLHSGWVYDHHTLNGQQVQLNKEKWRSVLMACGPPLVA